MCLNYPKLVHKHPAHLVSPSLQGIEGMQGALCTSLTRLKHIEPHRTFSNGVLTEMLLDIWGKFTMLKLKLSLLSYIASLASAFHHFARNYGEIIGNNL